MNRFLGAVKGGDACADSDAEQRVRHGATISRHVVILLLPDDECHHQAVLRSEANHGSQLRTIEAYTERQMMLSADSTMNSVSALAMSDYRTIRVRQRAVFESYVRKRWQRTRHLADRRVEIDVHEICGMLSQRQELIA